MSIVVVGSVAFDSVKTPYGAAERVLGGSANYFSLAASFFSPVRMVGVVGDDFPESHLEYLKSKNICTQGMVIVSGKTFYWKGEYEKDLSEAHTLQTHLNVFEGFKPELPPDYRDTPYVFLANIDPLLQMKVLEQVQSPKVIASDTMNFWIEGKSESLKKVLQKVDILMINEAEARQLSGETNLIRAVKKIKVLGPHTIVVKRGEHGALLYHEGEVFVIPAYPLETVHDPTGAGDTFAGGFMGYVSRSNDPFDTTTLRKAMLYGTILASFAVEDFSFNKLKSITWTDIEKRYGDLLSKISVSN